MTGRNFYEKLHQVCQNPQFERRTGKQSEIDLEGTAV
jgi:hypothetical protein